MNITRIENRLIVASLRVGVPVYDFDFDLNFMCTHPSFIEGEELCILRIGPISDYGVEFEAMLDLGLRPVNSLEEHLLASELESWYPRLEDLTPRTVVFDTLPDPDTIEEAFHWPIFLKGSRQTSRHNPDLSIIRDREQYEVAAGRYRADAILHWQKPVVREFIPLLPVPGAVAGKVPPSLEYRSFWWYGVCVGWGQYWYQVPLYHAVDAEDGLALAKEAAGRLQVPFLVVDFAKAADGQWSVIECNDGQESGYAGIEPRNLWRQILDRIEG